MASTTQARRSAEKHSFAELKSHKRVRESRSSKRQYGDGFNQKYSMGRNEHEFALESEMSGHKVGRASRFNSSDSRRRSSGYKFQEPGETLHYEDEDVVNMYERHTRGSSPRTRKLSSKSRHSGSNATSPHDRMQLSGSAAAPLRVLKPKLSSAAGKQHTKQIQQ